MKAKIIASGRIIDVEYVGFDMDGYDIYRETSTGIEWHQIELDFHPQDSVINNIYIFN